MELPQHAAVVATLQLTGPQEPRITFLHPGTAEASVTIVIGRAVLYLHSQRTVARFARVFNDARRDSEWLPRGQHTSLPSSEPKQKTRVRPARSPAGWAEASAVVHTGGEPASSVRLYKPVDRPTEPASSLVITIGEVQFRFTDQRAYRDCTAAMTWASEQATRHLPEADVRLAATPTRQEGAGQLAGAAVDRALQGFYDKSAAAHAMVEDLQREIANAAGSWAERQGVPRNAHPAALAAEAMPVKRRRRRSPAATTPATTSPTAGSPPHTGPLRPDPDPTRALTSSPRTMRKRAVR